MIREETDIKGLSARLNAQPFSNVYALSALAGYPASGGFYAAYSAGPGALVLCGGAAYPYLQMCIRDRYILCLSSHICTLRYP